MKQPFLNSPVFPVNRQRLSLGRRHFVSVDEIVDTAAPMGQASSLVPRRIHTSARLTPVQYARDASFIELA